MSLALAAAVPTLWGGGFGAPSQSVFVLLAGLALLLASICDRPAVASAVRSPLARVLLTLAVLSLVSAGWTVAASSAAIRSGLVVGGYFALVVVSRTTAARLGPPLIAAAIAGLAAVEASVGLAAVSMHALPAAERLGRVWRPGGTFEYDPALALLQAAVLPILAFAVARGRPLLQGGAAVATVLAGAVLGLAESRLALALSAVALLGFAFAPRVGRGTHAAAIIAAGLAFVGAVTAQLLLGYAVGPHAHAAGSAGLAGVFAVALLCGITVPVSRAARRREPPRPVSVKLLAVAVLIAAIVTAGYVDSGALRGQLRSHGPLHGQSSQPVRTDFLHERTHVWLAALQTWLDRPLAGAGAGSYWVASQPHQRVSRSLYAHDLPLELAAELGIPGLLLGIGIYAASGHLLWRTRSSADWWLLAPVVIAFLVSNLVDWTWHLAGWAGIWAAAAGGLLSHTAPGRTPVRRTGQARQLARRLLGRTVPSRA